MSNKKLNWRSGAVIAGLVLITAQSQAATRTFTIHEPFDLTWQPDRISYPVTFAQAEVGPRGIRLVDQAGRQVPAQLTDIEYWPDHSVKSAKLCLMVGLSPGETVTWTLNAGMEAVEQPKTDLTSITTGNQIELANAKTGIRLVGGKKTGAIVDSIPAPVQSVRVPEHGWIGSGWWTTDLRCTGYSAEITETGPVFARAKLRYEFEGGKFYAATVELNAGQDIAVVSEEFNLSEGKRYPMSGVPGMKADVKYGYVYPKFESPDKALIWQWWGQTHARCATPNAYYFSFGQQLKPDSAAARFGGSGNPYGNVEPGDGGLKYDKDTRFAYINTFFQYGDEETYFVGLYNSKDPAPMLAMVGLFPSRWLHPDINPHPDASLVQYTQTNCVSFEKRKNGDVFFRAPTCLGKRVYGISGMQRTFGKHIVADVRGPMLSNKETWGDDLMVRHERMGRLPLDVAKDWVLTYDEPAKYPRLYVPEGDYVRYLSRKLRKPMDEVKKQLAAHPGPTAADVKVVADALQQTRALVQFFGQVSIGNMGYGIQEGVLVDLAEDALSNPACTPAQAVELRKWLSAIAYFAVDPDFCPPREAGFAWGSANMMAQVQCRAARIVSLLPHHPMGKIWREKLAKVVTLYLEDQVNEAGITLECPHYGGMAITMPVMGLAAISSCGDIDLSRAEKRLRAAAHARLSMLLPWDLRGGFRSMSAEGDGYYSGEYTFAPLAGFFQNRDPQLAAQLGWGIAESNNELGEHADSSFKMVDVDFPKAQPNLVSEHLLGHGLVMRNGFPSHDEDWLQIYGDSFSYGHGHNDRGTWNFYAKGAPLMIDFAAMYTPSVRQAWLHPGGLTFNPDETIRPTTDDPRDDWWHKGTDEAYRKSSIAPFTMVEPSMSPDSPADIDRMGEIADFQSTPQADFAVYKRRLSYMHRVPYMLKATHGADVFNDQAVIREIYLKHPFMWTRRFVFVKDTTPLGHNYLVVRDDLPENSELDPVLNLWCLANDLKINGQSAAYAGQHGVDLRCYVANPASFTAMTRTYGHPCGFGFAENYKKTFGKPFREDQILMRVPQSNRGGGYFVVMVPVKQGEEIPKFETLAGGNAVRVTFTDRTDTIVLSPQPGAVEIDGVKVAGESALIVKRGNRTEVTVLGSK